MSWHHPTYAQIMDVEPRNGVGLPRETRDSYPSRDLKL
jgi:hypothetical protein